MNAVTTAQDELRRERGERLEEAWRSEYEQSSRGGAPQQEPPASMGIGVWASVDPTLYGSEWDKCAGIEATGMKYGYYDRYSENGELLCKVNAQLLSTLRC